MIAPQSATVFIAHPDGQEQRIEGTAQIDGSWVHVWPNNAGVPNTSYPERVVNAVEWDGDRPYEGGKFLAFASSEMQADQ